MTEQDWLSSADPAAMLSLLDGASTFRGQPSINVSRPRPSPRKLRLFACACVRAVWDGVECPTCQGRSGGAFCSGVCRGTGRVGGLTDPRSRRAVETAERFADGETKPRSSEVYAEAFRAIGAHQPTTFGERAAALAHEVVCARDEELLERCGRYLDCVPPAAQAALLRDIFGNPFRPVDAWRKGMRIPEGATVNTDFGKLIYQKPAPWLATILRWNDGTVPRIARGIYEERAWGRMPVLADALLDSGCDDEGLLRHCRGEERCPIVPVYIPDNGHTCYCDCKGTGWLPLRGPHVRGCWCVDLLLGKE